MWKKFRQRELHFSSEYNKTCYFLEKKCLNGRKCHAIQMLLRTEFGADIAVG
jgi:hypothetical protein